MIIGVDCPEWDVVSRGSNVLAPGSRSSGCVVCFPRCRSHTWSETGPWWISCGHILLQLCADAWIKPLDLSLSHNEALRRLGFLLWPLIGALARCPGVRLHCPLILLIRASHYNIWCGREREILKVLFFFSCFTTPAPRNHLINSEILEELCTQHCHSSFPSLSNFPFHYSCGEFNILRDENCLLQGWCRHERWP